MAISPQGRHLSVRSAPNEVRRGDLYRSCDTEHIWRWMMAALADLGERFAIQAIVPTSYGSTAALIDATELVLPILEYATDPPPELAAAYVEIAPWFEECYCPVNPASVTLGHQLFWLSREFPEAFARARWILPFAQYWAWGLAGVPACEVTSLGAQTQLWNPRERAFSSLVEQQGWADKFPPLRSAWEVLGPLQFEIAKKCASAGRHPGDVRDLRERRQYGPLPRGGPGRLHADLDRRVAGRLPATPAVGSAGAAAGYRRQRRPARPPGRLCPVHGWPGVRRDRGCGSQGCQRRGGRRRGARRRRHHGAALVHEERRPLPGHGRQGADRRRAAQFRARAGGPGQPVSWR